MNGEAVVGWTLANDKLTVPFASLPTSGAFSLDTVSAQSPASNLQLSGLYKSSGMFCTQCEAEGFRRISYMMDRPDVMAKYKDDFELFVRTAPESNPQDRRQIQKDLGRTFSGEDWANNAFQTE